MRPLPQKEYNMCRPATCKTCGKATWAGCGQHVDQVMAGVRAPTAAPGTPPPPTARFLGRLFRRG